MFGSKPIEVRSFEKGSIKLAIREIDQDVLSKTNSLDRNSPCWGAPVKPVTHQEFCFEDYRSDSSGRVNSAKTFFLKYVQTLSTGTEYHRRLGSITYQAMLACPFLEELSLLFELMVVPAAGLKK